MTATMVFDIYFFLVIIFGSLIQKKLLDGHLSIMTIMNGVIL